jgi:hypothetical protein
MQQKLPRCTAVFLTAALLFVDEAHMNADEKTLNTVLALRSFAQLRQVFEEYKAMAGHEFAKDIEKEFSKGPDAGMINIGK